jgi:hypothetical protein
VTIDRKITVALKKLLPAPSFTDRWLLITHHLLLSDYRVISENEKAGANPGLSSA